MAVTGTERCPFCAAEAIDVVAENDLAIAFRDRFPVSLGHTLIVTRRHVPDFFGCSGEERMALLALIDRVKVDLDRECHPHGYNVGFNAGEAAGQTVMHVHVHVIPRYLGDVDDPRGGVRFVIPDRANYLRQRAEILADGDVGGSLYLALAPLLARATQVDVLAAFVQDSGLALIEPAVQEALARGARLRILTGDYLNITQVDALRRLADWAAAIAAERGTDEEALRVAGDLEVRVIETEQLGGRAFHPKAWHLAGPDFGVAFVGSSNLSRSALSDGVEWNIRVDRHLVPRAGQPIGRCTPPGSRAPDQRGRRHPSAPTIACRERSAMSCSAASTTDPVRYFNAALWFIGSLPPFAPRPSTRASSMTSRMLSSCSSPRSRASSRTRVMNASPPACSEWSTFTVHGRRKPRSPANSAR